jgi:glycosyltransferase involved in cell wall biosynthesis
MTAWTLITGEYPPDCGGVGDYTAQLAFGLASAGDRVTVVTPATRSAPVCLKGVAIARLPDRFGPRSRDELTRIFREAPSRVLVQYVPSAFGLRGANVGWCRWLLRQVRVQHLDLRVMFHEPYFYFGLARPHRNALAAVQRVMAALLLRAAGESYVATETWCRYLEPYLPALAPEPVTLPIPSSIPRGDADAAARIRAGITGSSATPLVGHFGTYGDHIAPVLQRTLSQLLATVPDLSILCMGAGSDAFVARMLSRSPRLDGRLHATGRRAHAEIAAHVLACDLLVQPYPDGVTTRRTSVMAGLINARPVVTTSGPLTEPVWERTGAVALAAATSVDDLVSRTISLLVSDVERRDLAARGERAYLAGFALEHTIVQLRGGH